MTELYNFLATLRKISESYRHFFFLKQKTVIRVENLKSQKIRPINWHNTFVRLFFFQCAWVEVAVAAEIQDISLHRTFFMLQTHLPYTNITEMCYLNSPAQHSNVVPYMPNVMEYIYTKLVHICGYKGSKI